MKTRTTLGLLLGLLLAAAAAAQDSAERRIETLRLTDVAGEVHEPRAGARPPVVVLAWTSLGCPMSKVYLPRLHRLHVLYRERGVRFFLIDSSPQDSLEDLRALVRNRELTLPVVRDAEGALARSLGVTRTTECLVFDGAGLERYRGAVDDQYGYESSEDAAGGVRTYRKPEPRKQHLVDALDAVLAGRSVATPRTDPMGCALGLSGEGPRAELGLRAAGPVRYHEDVEPLLRRHCLVCHRAGGSGPFSLEGFEQAGGWAAMIAEVTGERRMPPWNANPEYGHFANDRSLSALEIETFRRWHESGAPEGDPERAAPPATWPEGWTIGTPDLVLETEEVEIPAEGRLPYLYDEVETRLEKDAWVVASEMRSTSPQAVHHVLVFLVEDRASRGRSDRPWRPRRRWSDLFQGLDGADVRRLTLEINKNLREERRLRGPDGRRGRTAPRGLDAGGLRGYFLADLAGGGPTEFGPGRAKFLPKGAKLQFQIHYTPYGERCRSKTRIALRLADEPPREVVQSEAASSLAIEIPPGAPSHEIRSTFTFPRDGTLLALRPHMHYRGRTFRYLVQRPGAAEEEILLDVPRYDFDWQLEYRLADPPRLPAGTRLTAVGTYDNSDANPYNPDPGETVYFGLQSDDEMFIGYFDVVWHDPQAEAPEPPREPAPPAEETKDGESSYVVLRAGLAGDDETARGFREVAEKAARHHGARLLDFDLEDWSKLERELRDAAPENVLVVLRPEALDVNLHRRLLLLSTRMDDDGFADFCFGYLTARDAEDLRALWERTVRVHEVGLRGRRWVDAAVTSGMRSRVLEGRVPELAKAAGFEGETIYFATREADPDALAFAHESLKRLEGASVVELTGNGDPEGIWLFDGRRNLDRTRHWPYTAERVGEDPGGEMPRILAPRFGKLRLDAPVVWSGTCHSAATRRVFVEGDIVSTFGRVERATVHELAPERSLALALLHAGAVAMIAPVAANHGMSVSREREVALTRGASLGEALRSTWDDVVLAAGGPPHLDIQVAGEPIRSEEAVMQGGGANRILLGDPALRPFEAVANPLETVSAETRDDGVLEVRVSWAEGWHPWAWDMYGTDRARDWRVTARVPLPSSFPEGDLEVEFRALGADEAPLPYRFRRAVVERRGRERILHLQADGPREEVERRAVRAVFAVRASAKEHAAR